MLNFLTTICNVIEGTADSSSLKGGNSSSSSKGNRKGRIKDAEGFPRLPGESSLDYLTRLHESVKKMPAYVSCKEDGKGGYYVHFNGTDFK